jgi:flagellar motor switch protein FliM
MSSPAEAHANEPARTRRVREIDFARPTKFGQDQQRRIERAHEGFCRSAGTMLSAELRHGVELELENVAQLTWTAALAEVPKPSLLAVLEVQPLGRRVLFSGGLDFVFRALEKVLGSPLTSEPPERDLTEIELILARRVFNVLLGPLSVTWDELLGVQLSLVGLESQEANLHLAPASEPTLFISLNVKIDDHSSPLTLVVPYSTIAPVVSRLPGGRQGLAGPSSDPQTAQSLRAALAGVGIELRAEVAAVELTIEEVLGLKPGDVLRLGASADAGVTLCANSVPIHRCKPGRSGTRRAVEVLERLEGLE